VLRRLLHPGCGFTQGLIADDDGLVWESTGNYGDPALLRYRLGDDHTGCPTTAAPDLTATSQVRSGFRTFPYWRPCATPLLRATSASLPGTMTAIPARSCGFQYA
jgi:hypothetical protein